MICDAKRIPLCEPVLSGLEQRYVAECLRDGWVSSVGPWVARLEREFAAVLGARFAVATSSGSAALHLALLVAGVEPGDIVLVPSLTFVATANAVRHAGAQPLFLDVEEAYGQLDPDILKRFLELECLSDRGETLHRRSGRRVRAVVPVHLYGHPCDLDSVLELSRDHGLRVVEDAAEAIGTRYRGQPVGIRGDVGVFSLNGNKLVTAGGGGVLVTAREDWAARARRLSSQCRDDPIEYTHDEVAFNYRLTSLAAAVACAQLERLEDGIASKRRIAAEYRRHLEKVEGLRLPAEAPWAFHSFWMFCVRVDARRFGRSSRELLHMLGERGIETRPAWTPLHRTLAHSGAPYFGGDIAERFCREALCLPCSVSLEDERIARVADAIVEAAR